jgi:hypothetical protein
MAKTHTPSPSHPRPLSPVPRRPPPPNLAIATCPPTLRPHAAVPLRRAGGPGGRDLRSHAGRPGRALVQLLPRGGRADAGGGAGAGWNRQDTRHVAPRASVWAPGALLARTSAGGRGLPKRGQPEASLTRTLLPHPSMECAAADGRLRRARLPGCARRHRRAAVPGLARHVPRRQVRRLPGPVRRAAWRPCMHARASNLARSTHGHARALGVDFEPSGPYGPTSRGL